MLQAAAENRLREELDIRRAQEQVTRSLANKDVEARTQLAKLQVRRGGRAMLQLGLRGRGGPGGRGRHAHSWLSCRSGAGAEVGSSEGLGGGGAWGEVEGG